jgi:glycosyltransferase involved in cell wall biosynthesis
METKLITIIMPAYNGERFIKQAIESVLEQTYTYWELIVMDDGSTDATADIVSGYKDSRIVYVHQENRGQAAALNRGLELARGTYITTLDVDDWYTPNSLQDRALFLDANLQFDVVYGDGIYCDENGNVLKKFSDLRTNEISGDVFDMMLSNSFFGTGANVMVRKSALEKHNIRYDEAIVWCQDYDLYLRLAEKCLFGFVNALTVWYRVHQDNMTLTMSSDRRRESFVRTKFKALNSARFSRTLDSHKKYFFYELIIHDLNNDVDRQMGLMEHSQFHALSRDDQARLMRLCASSHLSARRNIKEARELLRKSWRLNPFDLKTTAVMILAYFNEGPAERILNLWKNLRLRNQPASSPFDQSKK